MNFNNFSINTVATPTVETVAAPLEQVQDMNFFENWNDKIHSVQNVTLEQLRNSRPTLIKGQVVNGIEHYRFVERVQELAEQRGLHCDVIDQFAANQGPTEMPGIEQDKKAVDRWASIYKDEFIAIGQEENLAKQNALIKASERVDLTTIRRVFTTLHVYGDGIEKVDNNDCMTNIAIAYTPTNIQVGVGQMVQICHNQTILSANHIANLSSRGNGRDNSCDGFEALLDKVGMWLDAIHGIVDMDRQLIHKLMNTNVSAELIYAFIGYLQVQRVAHDAAELKRSKFYVKDYTLDNGQLSRFTKRLLLVHQRSGKEQLTAWDLYNAVNYEHKPAYWTETGTKVKKSEIHPMDFTKVLPQNIALLRAMQTFGLLPAEI